MPDGACDPYLATAALLHACRFGVEGGMVNQDPQPVGEEPRAFVHVPTSLSDALEAFHRDERLCEALGSELVTAFAIPKQAEWDRYVKAVADPGSTETTDWELAYDTPFF